MTLVIKHIKMLNCIIAITFLPWSSATVTVKAPCPDVSPVENFKPDWFADGLWYQIARYPNNLEGRGDCTTLEFKREAGKIEFIITDVADKKKFIFNGYVDQESNNTSVVTFVSKTFNVLEGSKKLPVHILSIDKEKYAIGYECRYNETTKFRHDYAWVASRTKQLDTESKTIVDNFLKTSFIDSTKLVWDHFTKNLCSVEA